LYTEVRYPAWLLKVVSCLKARNVRKQTGGQIIFDLFAKRRHGHAGTKETVAIATRNGDEPVVLRLFVR
jgi:hypothetical protein